MAQRLMTHLDSFVGIFRRDGESAPPATRWQDHRRLSGILLVARRRKAHVSGRSACRPECSYGPRAASVEPHFTFADSAMTCGRQLPQGLDEGVTDRREIAPSQTNILTWKSPLSLPRPGRVAMMKRGCASHLRSRVSGRDRDDHGPAGRCLGRLTSGQCS